MKYLKRGDTCPICGQPIKTDKYEELELLSCWAWLRDHLGETFDVCRDGQNETEEARL